MNEKVLKLWKLFVAVTTAVFLLFLGARAFAQVRAEQDGGVLHDPGSVPDAGVIVGGGGVVLHPDDPLSDAGTLFNALAKKQWWLVAAIVLVVAIYALRKTVFKNTWFSTKWGGWTMNVGSALILALASYFAQGTEVTLMGVGLALLTAVKLLSASGTLWMFSLDSKIVKKSPADKTGSDT